MERPYLDKWKLYLLSEAKGPEKPPYFKNMYGSIFNITKANTKEVEETMSRILKQTVNIEIWDTNPIKISCNSSGGSILYVESIVNGKPTWERWNISRDMSYIWGSEGSKKYMFNYDKDWSYLRTALVDDSMKKKYFVHKNDDIPIKMSSQLMPMAGSQSSGDTFVELRPGTKAYEAVKHKVFKD